MQAKELYLEFIERLRSEYVPDRVKDGIFGAMMHVSLVNDVSPCYSVCCRIFVPYFQVWQYKDLLEPKEMSWEAAGSHICRGSLPTARSKRATVPHVSF